MEGNADDSNELAQFRGKRTKTVTRKMGFDACKQLVPPGRSVGAAFPP
jgi:hypothetical protein